MLLLLGHLDVVKGFRGKQVLFLIFQLNGLIDRIKRLLVLWFALACHVRGQEALQGQFCFVFAVGVLSQLLDQN